MMPWLGRLQCLGVGELDAEISKVNHDVCALR